MDIQHDEDSSPNISAFSAFEVQVKLIRFAEPLPIGETVSSKKHKRSQIAEIAAPAHLASEIMTLTRRRLIAY